MRPGGVAAAGLATALLAGGCSVLSHSAPLTFQVDDVECGPTTTPGAIGTVCSFLAYYGNVGGKPVQVEPAQTTVLDKNGRAFVPTAQATSGGFLLKPGVQKSVNWSVTLPANTKPASVRWHGSVVQVSLLVATTSATSGVPTPTPSGPASAPAVESATPSAAPSNRVPSSLVPSVTPPPTPAVTTTTPKPKPSKTKTKTKAKPTTAKPTTAKPTTKAPTTTAAPTTTPPPAAATTTHRVVHNPPPPPTTTNPTNPGGGVGGIG